MSDIIPRGGDFIGCLFILNQITFKLSSLKCKVELAQ